MLGQIAAGGASVAGYRSGGGLGSLYFLVACIVSWFSWSVPIAVTLLVIVPAVMLIGYASGFKEGGSLGSLYVLVAIIVSWFLLSIPTAITLLVIVPTIVWPLLALMNKRYFVGISLLILSVIVNLYAIPFTWGLI